MDPMQREHVMRLVRLLSVHETFIGRVYPVRDYHITQSFDQHL